MTKKLPTHLHRQGYSDKRDDGKIYRKGTPLTEQKNNRLAGAAIIMGTISIIIAVVLGT